MKPIVALLALVALTAGCFGNPPGSTDDGGPNMPQSPPVAGDAKPDLTGAVALPLDATLTTPGYLHYDAVSCGPTTPGGCEIYAHEPIYVHGTLEGVLMDAGHPHVNADTSYEGVGYQTFTGSVAGCGAGTMQFFYTMGGGEPDPDHPGDFVGWDNLTLVPGSQSTGLLGVVDAKVDEAYHLNYVTGAGAGTITGTLWCRSPPTLPTSHDGAQAVAVQGTAASAGFIEADTGTCDPFQAGVCEGFATLTAEMTGSMAGTLIDIFSFHANPDASIAAGSIYVKAVRPFTGAIAGCGSGAMTLLSDGTLARPDPDLAHPGYLHVKEPAMHLAPGSTSTGLAGVIDAEITFDFRLMPGAMWEGTYEGTVWCFPAEASAAASSHDGAREIPIDVAFFTPGWTVYDQVVCTPSNPGACEIYYTETLYVSGSMNASILDTGHAHFLPDGTSWLVAIDVFVGSVDGCGSGALAFAATGTSDAVPVVNPEAEVSHGYETWTLIPGSTTVGFAGLADAQLDVDYTINAVTGAAHGTLKGTFWCR